MLTFLKIIELIFYIRKYNKNGTNRKNPRNSLPKVKVNGPL